MEGQEYIEYIVEFSLVMVAASIAYLFDPSNLATAVVFVFIPVLFGYTAFISEKGFHYSSLLSIFALVFLTVDRIAPVAIIISVGNPLISALSSGSSFKDYYKTVSVPMLLTGFILGAAVFGAATHDAEIRKNVKDTISNAISSQISNILSETEIVEIQKKANRKMIKGTSQATITLTKQYVINDTENLSIQDRQTVLNSLDRAQREVPSLILNKTQNRTEALNMSQTASKSVQNLITDDNLILLVPLIGMGFYSLHPLIGLLTALFGTLFSYLEKRIGEV